MPIYYLICQTHTPFNSHSVCLFVCCLFAIGRGSCPRPLQLNARPSPVLSHTSSHHGCYTIPSTQPNQRKNKSHTCTLSTSIHFSAQLLPYVVSETPGAASILIPSVAHINTMSPRQCFVVFIHQLTTHISGTPSTSKGKQRTLVLFPTLPHLFHPMAPCSPTYHPLMKFTTCTHPCHIPFSLIYFPDIICSGASRHHGQNCVRRRARIGPGPGNWQ